VSEKKNKDSRLLPVLREGVAVIQMIFFKNLKPVIVRKYPNLENAEQIMLTGAITNEIFGSHNKDAKFLQFHAKHRGDIEQELLAIKDELPQLVDPLADALRIQVLCDKQEEIDSSNILLLADSINLLPAEREVPMPSAFMETVRTLGALYKLIVPPAEINAQEDNDLIQ
jgi:ABC-type transporter Mla MlaB component